MVRCVVCSNVSPRMLGPLCVACATKLPRADWHVPKLVHSNVASNRAEVWLIDPWGQRHAVGDRTSVGRLSQFDTLVISDRSVSADHALLRKSASGWKVRDRGSTNGTHVNGQRFVREQLLQHLCIIRFSSLGFYFWNDSELPTGECVAAPLSTAPANALRSMELIGPLRQRLLLRPHAADVPVNARGMVQFFDPMGAVKHDQLSRLQYQLLHRLCLQAMASDFPDGRFVSTNELCRVLPFQSPRPTSANVRQVVKTLRCALRAIGIVEAEGTDAHAMIESREYLGYRITWRPRYLDTSQ